VSDGEALLQLVSSTGDDRYLAVGIRGDENDEESVAGDVIVGWINSKSGRGGVDDYFLASENIGCDDGAESCPDKSKGGLKNVELLNSVSRENYTMLTLRRSLMAEDDYDVTIKADGTLQRVFWSVGYKSPSMRRRHKPVKNKGGKNTRYEPV